MLNSSAPAVTDTFIFWNARPGWAALTSAKWLKSPPGSICGASGPASKSPAARNLIELPAVRGDYAGLILSLARQEDPDTSAYNDPEIALRLKRRHHAGLVLRSSDPARIQTLLENYSRRFAEEFLAIEPPGTKPAA